MRRPLIGVSLSIVIGMLFASSGLGAFLGVAILALLLLTTSLVLNDSRVSTLLTFLTIAAVSACLFLVRAPGDQKLSAIPSVNAVPRSDVSFVGRIAEFPVFYAGRSGHRGFWVFPLWCEGIQASNGWTKVRGEIDVRMEGGSMDHLVAYGQRIKVAGKLTRRIFPGGNPMELNVYSAQDVHILENSGKGSLITWGRALRDAASVHLEAGMKNMQQELAVLKALVLGYRRDLSTVTVDAFRRTGTMHIFAISGLHVGIVGLFLCILLKTMGVPRDWFGVWLLPLLALYVISTGMKSSALRALAMAGIFLLAPLFRRKPDIPSSVACAAILLLLFQPMEIQSGGFVFSFTVVSFLVMVYAKVPETLKKGGWIRSYGTGLVITSFAANLASIPLAALYFGTFSPIALLGNLVVVPLTFCIVLSGWLSILVHPFSVVFNHAAALFIKMLLGSVAWLDSLPGSSWQVNPPPLLSIVLWYGSLIYFFTHAAIQRERRLALWGAGCAVLLALLG